MLKSWPSCLQKFELLDGHDFNVHHGQDFNVYLFRQIFRTFGLPQITAKALFLQCFQRNFALDPQEPTPPKETPNSHNFAHRLHIKGPLVYDQNVLFLKKTPSSANPQNGPQKHRVQQNSFVVQCFEFFCFCHFLLPSKNARPGF